MPNATALRHQALTADGEGRLHDAMRLVQQVRLHDHETAESLTDAFLLKAQIFRHHDQSVSIASALDAASQAVRLSELAGFETTVRGQLAAVELAACLLAVGKPGQAIRVASDHLHSVDAVVASRAWSVTGHAHLQQGNPFRSVSALSNSVAELERCYDNARCHVRLLSLSHAFTAAGRIHDAQQILEKSKPQWSGEENQRRLSIHHRLLLANNYRCLGQIADALAALVEAEEFLSTCQGLEQLRTRLLITRAACLREWGQYDTAQEISHAASTLLNSLSNPPDVSQVLPAPPSLELAVPVNPCTPTPHTTTSAPYLDLREDLDDELQRLHTRSASVTVSAARDIPVSGIDFAQDLVTEISLTPLSTEDQLSFFIDSVYAALGAPGNERGEAQLLLDAGIALSKTSHSSIADAARQTAQRMLHGCLTRIRWLPGLDLVKGRALIALARITSSEIDAQRTLTLLVEGLQIIDSERIHMGSRLYRHNWLRAEVHPALAQAIELAAIHDRPLAADLIVFSRNSGIVVPDVARPGVFAVGDVSLLPMPRLRYLNGDNSALGSDDHTCNYL